jgi:hypothetical protein
MDSEKAQAMTNLERETPRFQVTEDRHSPGDWRVENIDYGGEGECLSVIFTGSGAEDMAREYAAWKNGKLSDSLAS